MTSTALLLCLLCGTLCLRSTASLALPSPCPPCPDIATLCPESPVIASRNRKCPICPCQAPCPSPVGCLYGLDIDFSGCAVCQNKPGCPTSSCPETCPSGYLTDSSECKICTCQPVICTAIGCADSCPGGYVIGSNGCPTCECKCKPAKCDCPDGEIWTTDSSGCPICYCKIPQLCPQLDCPQKLAVCGLSESATKSKCPVCPCYPNIAS